MKKNLLWKRILAAALCLTLVVGSQPYGVAAPLPEAEQSETLTGTAMAAVNTSWDTEYERLVEGTFGSLRAELLPGSGASAGKMIADRYIHRETGAEITVTTPVFDPLVPVAAPDRFQSVLPGPMASSHGVDDQISLPDINSVPHQMTCLYVGTYCTVWGSVQDAADVRIDQTIAAEIAGQFDIYYSQVINAFGKNYDADGDGKVAIFCYDIDGDYGTQVSAYTAGFFRPADMVAEDGSIGSQYVSPDNFTVGMDSIHLDTYPTMGYDTPMSDIGGAYSTLVHEFQHLVNFSGGVLRGCLQNSMDTYLNEAFSMAAEHLICGSDSTYSRVWYFNSSNYAPGWPLTFWAGDLSNYSNSYLFGQYIRTRYAALTGTDGSTIYKAILEANAADFPATCSDTELVAGILNTTAGQLILDFWAAVYLKQSTGVYGFGGETWANEIRAQISGYDPVMDEEIYNGGAKFYGLFANYIVPDSQNLTFLAFGPDGIMEPEQLPEGVLDSGTCGDELTWILYEDGKLVISGTGDLKDDENPFPWKNHLRLIKTVVIESGVTSVGAQAFMNCEVLTEVILPQTVSTIGEAAFRQCSALEKIVLPDSLTEISSALFYGCHSLEEITIPDGVTIIGSYAFAGCVSMTEINIPAGVTGVDDSAFSSCGALSDVYYGGTRADRELITIGTDNESLINATWHYMVRITIAEAWHGSVTLSHEYAAVGTTVEVTGVTAEEGYWLSELWLNGEKVTGASFVVPADVEELVVTPVFAEIYPGIEFAAQGTCSTAVWWGLTGDGRLMVCGLGGTEDYADPADAPWYSHRGSITYITVEEGITHLGRNAFGCCEALNSVFLNGKALSIAAGNFGQSTLQHVFYNGSADDWAAVTAEATGNEKLSAVVRMGLPMELNMTLPYGMILGTDLEAVVTVTTDQGEVVTLTDHYTLTVTEGTGRQIVTVTWNNLSMDAFIEVREDTFGTLTLAGGSADVKLVVKTAGTALVAFYDADGRLLGVALREVTEGENGFAVAFEGVDLTGSTWKIMVVDGGFAPTCPEIRE